MDQLKSEDAQERLTERKPYESPRLVRYGTLQQVTMGLTDAGKDDGTFNPALPYVPS